ncbi:Type 1 glutamine amidotransferase-like domain-containing protein [Fusibacter bizertensis]
MKLFLTSFFKCVAQQLKNYTSCVGEKLIFITTASKVETVDFYVAEDREALRQLGFIVEELDISVVNPDAIREKINNCDCVFVEGGNTFYLLQELKRTGTDQMLLSHIKNNKMYIGASAGSIIASKSIEFIKGMDDSSYSQSLEDDYSALNIVDFYIVPHYKNAPFEKAADKIIQEYSGVLQLYPISNHQAIVVNEDKIEQITA